MRIDCVHFGTCIFTKTFSSYDYDVNCKGCKLYKSILFDSPKRKATIIIKPELKPCPFCGGEAEIKKDTKCGGHGEYYPVKWVQCKECGSRITQCVCDGYYGCDITDEELAEKWNRRV